ncbi:hypothetical protein PpBr36_05059 [Pyricularia pennisetigena]|uniref:hypothetical protein n=1 Tax=Pyricularia pennisetigena TaxID=1578925 RepID=UPI0011536375|nr:hypothetical protein PpBr36_05059 [Pyricularia pennisetigena]TLS26997.1 hypothetical protein PpBr36_05059 [Pyricularia pennisetigena]
MAPIAPKKRTSMRAKAARAATSSSSSSSAAPKRTETTTSSLLADTKRDRRQIKRSSFLSQIATKSSSGKITKRRRPSKKLAANLESLADALPDLDELEEKPEPGKVRLKSIRSRPGALKRKEKLVRAEAKNIGLSMAYLTKLQADGGGASGSGDQDEAMAGAREQDEKAGAGSEKVAATAPSSTASRWAALRAHISGTMEQNPAFLEKK